MTEVITQETISVHSRLDWTAKQSTDAIKINKTIRPSETSEANALTQSGRNNENPSFLTMVWHFVSHSCLFRKCQNDCWYSGRENKNRLVAKVCNSYLIKWILGDLFKLRPSPTIALCWLSLFFKLYGIWLIM